MKTLGLPDEAFVTDAKGKRVGVVLDLKTYERLRDAEEELRDVRAYDTAKAKATADLHAGHFTSLAEYKAKRSRKK